MLKGLAHLVQSCLSYRSCMSKDSAHSTCHVGHFFPKNIAWLARNQRLKFSLISVLWRHLKTVITFCCSDTFMAHILYSGLTVWQNVMFCYSKHLHVNRNYRPNGTATSLLVVPLSENFCPKSVRCPNLLVAVRPKMSETWLCPKFFRQRPAI